MIWDADNCMPRTTIHIAGEPAPIKHVFSVDDVSNTITMAHLVDGKVYCSQNGVIATETRKVDSIYPIFAGYEFPMMFLCFDHANSQ